MKKINNETKKEIEIGKRYAVFACIDYVGSTELIKIVGKKEAERRINFYRDIADRIFENFKGIGKGWSGEGNVFYFFYSKDNKSIEDSAVKSAMNCLSELKVRSVELGEGVDIPVRISIGAGIVEYQKDLGKITSLEISLTGHINSACPENSILITENVYFGLSDELKNKFKICGITKRDGVLTFIYPIEKKNKIKREDFLNEEKDYSKDYFDYIKFIESSNTTLLVVGVRQIEKIPTLDLEEGFFPLRLAKAKRMIFRQELLKKYREFEEKIIIEDVKDVAPRNFLDVLKTDKHIVILGDPGAGKTTLLRYVALIYSRGLKKVYERFGFDECLLPIIVPISEMYSLIENKSFVDAISDYYKIQGIENTEKFIKENLDKGRCIILLDGLDEVPKQQERFSIVGKIENFIRRYSNNRFIVTSRIVGYEKINIDSITEYYISQLDDSEIEKFTYNWFMAFEKKINKGMPENAIKKIVDNEVAQLLNSINEDKNIKDLAKNPFLLSLICLVQKSGYRLPRYRIELYRIITETLFETWVMARSISRRSLVEPIDYKEGERILAPLALWVHENCPGGIEKEDILKEKIIEIMKKRGITENEAKSTTNKFFEYLAKQTQIIIPKGRDFYGFRHLSFEEFLAARALIMKEEYNEYLKKYGEDPRWTDVFLLTAGWLGIVDGREGEVTRIVKQLTESKNDSLLLLAGRIVAENLGVETDVGKEVIEKIGHRYLSIYFETFSEKEILKKKLEKDFKKTHEMYEILKRTLLRKEGKETYEKFITILKNKKENERVRGEVAYVLSSLVKQDVNIKEIFIKILKDKEEYEWVRGKALSVLSSLVKQDVNIKENFIKILKDKEENKFMQGEVAHVLSSLVEQDEDVKEIFIKILKDKEEYEWVRGRVAYGLSSLVEQDVNIKEIFIKILKDKEENKFVQGEVAYGLSSLVEQDVDVKEIFIKILKDKEENERVRGKALSVLSSLVEQDVDVKEIFIKILKDKEENKFVRGKALSVLSSLVVKQDVNIKEIFIKILKDKEENKFVRREVAYSLSSLVKQDVDVKEIFIKILKDKEENEWVRGKALSVLSSLVKQDVNIKEIFIKILKDKEENERMREEVVDSLSLLIEEDVNIKEILIMILKDKEENEWVRKGAAYSLSSLVKEDANIKEILIEILKDKKENELVRKGAAYGLSSLVKEDANIKEILIEILKDKKENEFVREEVVEGLSPLVKEDANIKEIFVEILKDKNESKALKEIIRKHLNLKI